MQVDAALTVALAHYEAGRPRDAIRELKAAAREHPRDPTVFHSLGQLLAEAGDGPSALAMFQKAIQLDGDHIGAHYSLANAHAADRPDEAMAHFGTVLRLAPAHTDAMNNLANLLRSAQQFSEASVESLCSPRSTPKANAGARS